MTNEATKFLLMVEAAVIIPAFTSYDTQLRMICSCLVIVSTFMIIVINFPKFKTRLKEIFKGKK